MELGASGGLHRAFSLRLHGQSKGESHALKTASADIQMIPMLAECHILILNVGIATE